MLNDYTRSPGGASLTAAFSLLMGHPTFKTAVGRRMSYDEKLRLFALHQQAVHGDAPQEEGGKEDSPATREMPSPTSPSFSLSTPPSPASPSASPAAVTSSSSARAVTTNAKGGESSTPPAAVQSTGAPLPWLDFAGRARQQRWATLRGRMTPQVAREAFCAEFLAMVDKYPCREMAPLVAAALARAHAEQEENEESWHATPHPTRNSNSSSSGSDGTAARSERVVFCIRAFQHDPAALAMLWVCRAHGIACEFTAEPLSAALDVVHPTAAAAVAAASTPHARPRKGSKAEQDLFYSAVSVLEGKVFVPIYTGLRRGQCFIAEVQGPEAGLQLLCDTFLAHMPHWSGRSEGWRDAQGSDTRGNPDNSYAANAAALRRAAERAEWMEDLANVSANVRDPIMALLIDEATDAWRVAQHFLGHVDKQQEFKGIGKVATTSGVTAGQPNGVKSNPPPIRVVAARLDHFQRTFTQKRAQRELFERATAASDRTGIAAPMGTGTSPIGRKATEAARDLLHAPLLEVEAAVKAVDIFYKRNPADRLVSCADLYVACCGYILCTSPFSQRLFPHLNSFSSAEGMWRAIRLSALGGEQGTHGVSSRSGNSSLSSPEQLPPVRLFGMPPGYNDLINAMLKREARSAFRALDSPTSSTVNIRPFHDNEASVAAVQRGREPATSTINAFAAADALQHYMLSQMLSLNADDMAAKAAGKTGPQRPSELVNGALTPYLVLAHIFTGAWYMAHRQCVGFPFLSSTGTPPTRQVNFLWRTTGTPSTHGKAEAVNHLAASISESSLKAIPESRLGSGEGFGVDSWESRMRHLGWSVVDHLTASSSPHTRRKEREAADRSKTPPRRRVYLSDGHAQAKL